MTNTYKLHIIKSAGIHYLCIMTGDMRAAQRPIAKRDLLLFYHDATAHLSGEVKKTAHSVERGNIFIKRRGQRFAVACRDDGYEFPIEPFNLVSIHSEAYRFLSEDNPLNKPRRKAKASLVRSRQLEMFPHH